MPLRLFPSPEVVAPGVVGVHGPVHAGLVDCHWVERRQDPDVAKAAILLPGKSQDSRNVSMMLGSLYPHIGNPIRTVSYFDMSAAGSAISGLHDLSFITTDLQCHSST